MALQTLEGAGVWVPGTLPGFSEDAAYLIDASGEFAAIILRCPKAGNIDRFDANVYAVGNSPENGLRLSLQSVSATTGLPSGTILGATNNGFVTYAHTVTTGWKATNFGEVVTVTRNQLIACVIDIPTFTAGDSVTMRSLAGFGFQGFPYGVSGVGTRSSSDFPLMALHYTDGYVSISPMMPAIFAEGSVMYNVDSATADEWGLGFQVPWPCSLNRIRVMLTVTAGADFEVLVYDNTNAVISTLSHDGDVTTGTNVRFCDFFTQTALALLPNTTYTVAIRPTTTNNVTMTYNTFNSAEHMLTMSGGDNFYMRSRLNQGGSWTDYNTVTFRRPRIALELLAFDDAVGSGGGGSVFGGLVVH